MRPGIFLLLLTSLAFTACQSSHDDATTTPASAAVSSIPWNRPASWEGSGALGGFAQQGSH